MYVPAFSHEQDPEVLFALVDAYPFATLITWAESEPVISHVPLVLQRGASVPCLLGHFARANPHVHALAQGSPTLAIFQGPHGYISPAWYAQHPSVPTWNYAVVHIHGRPQLVDAAGTKTILRCLVEKFEAGRQPGWSGKLPPEFLAEELGFIVGFELTIERLEGKFKLSQNKPESDREGALAGLEQEGHSSKELAEFMRQYFARKSGV